MKSIMHRLIAVCSAIAMIGSTSAFTQTYAAGSDFITAAAEQQAPALSFVKQFDNSAYTQELDRITLKKITETSHFTFTNAAHCLEHVTALYLQVPAENGIDTVQFTVTLNLPDSASSKQIKWFETTCTAHPETDTFLAKIDTHGQTLSSVTVAGKSLTETESGNGAGCDIILYSYCEDDMLNHTLQKLPTVQKPSKYDKISEVFRLEDSNQAATIGFGQHAYGYLEAEYEQSKPVDTERPTETTPIQTTILPSQTTTVADKGTEPATQMTEATGNNDQQPPTDDNPPKEGKDDQPDDFARFIITSEETVVTSNSIIRALKLRGAAPVIARNTQQNRTQDAVDVPIKQGRGSYLIEPKNGKNPLSGTIRFESAKSSSAEPDNPKAEAPKSGSVNVSSLDPIGSTPYQLYYVMLSHSMDGEADPTDYVELVFHVMKQNGGEWEEIRSFTAAADLTPAADANDSSSGCVIIPNNLLKPETGLMYILNPRFYETAADGSRTEIQRGTGKAELCGFNQPKGDITGDGVITVADAVELLHFLSTGEAQFLNQPYSLYGVSLKTADLNSDGRIDATDLALLKRSILYPPI